MEHFNTAQSQVPGDNLELPERSADFNIGRLEFNKEFMLEDIKSRRERQGVEGLTKAIVRGLEGVDRSHAPARCDHALLQETIHGTGLLLETLRDLCSSTVRPADQGILQGTLQGTSLPH